LQVPVSTKDSDRVFALKVSEYLVLGQAFITADDSCGLSLTKFGSLCIEQTVPANKKKYYYPRGRLSKARFLNLSYEGRLCILDTTGKLLWKSPAVVDESDIAKSFFTFAVFTLLPSGSAGVEAQSPIRGRGGKTETLKGWSTDNQTSTQRQLARAAVDTDARSDAQGPGGWMRW
jgi:hypothetical protein